MLNLIKNLKPVYSSRSVLSNKVDYLHFLLYMKGLVIQLSKL